MREIQKALAFNEFVNERCKEQLATFDEKIERIERAIDSGMDEAFNYAWECQQKKIDEAFNYAWECQQKKINELIELIKCHALNLDTEKFLKEKGHI